MQTVSSVQARQASECRHVALRSRTAAMLASIDRKRACRSVAFSGSATTETRRPAAYSVRIHSTVVRDVDPSGLRTMTSAPVRALRRSTPPSASTRSRRRRVLPCQNSLPIERP